jgi:signal transduction histidine kinase
VRLFGDRHADLEDITGASLDEILPDGVFGPWIRDLAQEGTFLTGGAMKSVVARSGDTERIFNVSVTRGGENAMPGVDIIVTLEDITVQKRGEQRLFDLERTSERGEMATAISHELNNFLAMVLAGVDVAEMAAKADDRSKLSTTLERIRDTLGRMERFTRGLMDFQNLEPRMRRTNLNSLIMDVLSFASAQERFRAVAISPGLDCRLPEFQMDPDQVSQMLLNLLNNAADAIAGAGKGDGEIAIRTLRDKGEALLIVSDNGGGMTEEVKERLFRSRVTTKAGGHGYGLITTARIVENHGASIAVASEPGMGTTFTIRFPTRRES